MTEEEYEARREELNAEADILKKEYSEARRRYEKVTNALVNLRIDYREQQRLAERTAPTHKFAGSHPNRAKAGKPGHCEDCARKGHVIAHPRLGCADVGCDKPHPEAKG